MGWFSLHVLSYHIFHNDSGCSFLSDKMLPHTSLTSMTWMLLSCLMLFSQVQGKVFMSLELNFL